MGICSTCQEHINEIEQLKKLVRKAYGDGMNQMLYDETATTASVEYVQTAWDQSNAKRELSNH